MAPFHWTCPYCDRDTTITNSDYETPSFTLTTANSEGKKYFLATIIVCPNPKCKKFTLTLRMREYKITSGQVHGGDIIKEWNLVPPSSAKVFPDYVPEAICADYLEACLIRDQSAKASATLSRRCLQGMIRDFWGIKKARLVDEIEALEDKTDADTWAAIDATRKIGNIGAHMEKDINVIVDVDPGEAQALIGLIELLVKDWYTTRHERKERLNAIVKIKDEKEAAKDGKPAPSVEAVPTAGVHEI